MNTAYKKVTSRGSVGIPAAMRRELGIEPEDPVTVDAVEGKIILSPYLLRCTFCGTAEGVGKFRGKGICSGCLDRIREQTGGGR